MNLTTPPPVEPLAPDYATDLQHDLVRRARKQHRIPAWTPVLAAACGIAIVIAGGLFLTRKDNLLSPADRPSIVQVPADKSPTQSLDLGPASDNEASVAAVACLAKEAAAAKPNEYPEGSLDPATIQLKSARWIKGLGTPGRARELVQSFMTANSVWFLCVDGQPQSYEGVGDGAADDVVGSWSWANVGSPSMLRATFSFRSLAIVTKVELRVRGTEGASPWSVVSVADRGGYVTAVLPDARAQHGWAQVDIRGLDATGKVLFEKTVG
ncbi:hypothetical protein [Kribbella jiaozuonensis]|uniref:Uncharacterized protein n=1 Tax=Kribbella jiaozuonensis TaxID=2575441 RepID=A0A4U3LLP0_9ACTN|nr:hypothetical protein [Kribbella jiaozuonensis]TKK76688.1 hypothetical protein FDA38_30520 [Kribbella jiaozuonensis]